jgi:hypothetical protein
VRFFAAWQKAHGEIMANDLHYFMFFVGRLFQGAEMMIRHSEYIEADESNLMYDFVAAREATREALKDVKGFLEKISVPDTLGDT